MILDIPNDFEGEITLSIKAKVTKPVVIREKVIVKSKGGRPNDAPRDDKGRYCKVKPEPDFSNYMKEWDNDNL